MQEEKEEKNKNKKETAEVKEVPKEIKREVSKEKEKAEETRNLCSYCGKEREKLQVCECNKVIFFSPFL